MALEKMFPVCVKVIMSIPCIYGDLLFGQFNQYFSNIAALYVVLLCQFIDPRFRELFHLRAFSLLLGTSNLHFYGIHWLIQLSKGSTEWFSENLKNFHQPRFLTKATSGEVSQNFFIFCIFQGSMRFCGLPLLTRNLTL